MSGQCVAPDETGTLRCRWLSLCRVRFKGLPDDFVQQATRRGVTVFELYLESMTFDLVDKAYLAFLPRREGQSARAFYGVTQDGGMYRADRPMEELALPEGGEYSFFWTLSKKVFDEVRALLSGGQEEEALRRFEFQVMKIRPAITDEDRKREDSLFVLPEVLLRDAVLDDPATTEARGYWDGEDLQKATDLRAQWGGGPDASDGRPPFLYWLANDRALHGLYAYELLRYRAAGMRARACREYMVFEHVKGVIRCTEAGSRVESIDRSHFPDEPEFSFPDWVKYAHDCAITNQIGRARFIRTLDLPGGEATPEEHQKRHAEWYHDVLGVFNLVPSVGKKPPWHSRHKGDGVFIPLRDDTREMTIHYFDLYQLGTQEKMRDWYRALVKAESGIASAVQDIDSVAAGILHERSPFRRFMFALDHRFDADVVERAAFHARSLNAWLGSRYAWWNDIPVVRRTTSPAKPDPDLATWDDIAPHLAWISSLTDKGGEALGRHFTETTNIKFYNELVKGEEPALQAMLSRIEGLYDPSLRPPDLARVSPSDALRVHVKGKVATVDRLSDGARIAVIQLRATPPHWRMDTSIEKLEWAVANEAVIQKPLLQGPGKPAPFKFVSAFGDALSLAMSLGSVTAELQSGHPGVVPFLELGRDVFQSLESGSNAVDALLRSAGAKNGFLGLGEKLAIRGPGALLEAGLNLREGMVLLFGEESDTTEALARGQTGLAVAHHMRGAFIAGTTGVGLAYGAAAGYTAWGTSSLAFAASAFLAPLGVALAVVAIGGIVLSLGFYLFSPKDDTPENKMKPLRDALDLAASVELGVTEKGGEPDKARTVRALEDLAFFCRTLRRGS